MAFVREVQMELRKADKRKLIYRGKTADGKNIDVPLLLPPSPNNATGEEWLPDDELSAAGLDVFKIDLGGTAGVANQKKVYDFVKSHMAKQSSDYVVSATFDDADVYGKYLVNLVYVQSGFNQIYNERAHEMFGKDYYSIGKEEYAAVRLGVPMAISVADVKL